MAIALVGKKLGMTRLMADDGSASSVSVIKIEPNRVVQSKSVDTDGYNAVQVTTGKKTNKKGDAKIRRVSSSLKGHYAKASQEIGLGLWEMRVSEGEASDMPNLDVSYFGAGHYVNVTGKSKGKGFQGGVKRHNFSMQDATHGNSVSHRAIGSTGQCQDPGRVFKGKKMAGQLGNVRNTIQNLVIVKILLDDNTLLVKGSIPGHDGSNVIIKPTRKKYTPREILTIEETVVEEVKAAAPSKESKPAENVKAEKGTKE